MLLAESIALHFEDTGDEILEKHKEAVRPAMEWLGYLRSSQVTGSGDQLLDGLQASLIETAGCLMTGFVRPAVFTMRTQVDIVMAWLFFKDHPVEWDHVEVTGDKYRLVSEVLKYLSTYNRMFRKRLELLRSNRTRGDEDPYRLLSAHTHGQNSATLPPLVKIDQLVQTRDRCLDGVRLQLEISEYLSDVLTACFAEQWADLPEPITNLIRGRLRPAQLKNLCAL